MVRNRAVAAVERGVEAGDLGKTGHASENRTNRREVVGLVKRRQRHIAFEIGQHLAVDQDGPVVIRAAMRDPMPDRDGLKVLRVTQPGSGRHERGPNIANLVRGIGLVDYGCLVGRRIEVPLGYVVDLVRTQHCGR